MRVIGVDEAGRGPLAGPVVAAAVELNPEKLPVGIRDSKKLTAKNREVVAVEIQKSAARIGIGIVHEQDIDRINILQATFRAMRSGLEKIDLKNAQVLVDGKFTIPNLNAAQNALVNGDDLSISIGAASIIAKTFRDRMMLSYHVLFPEYGFDSHKGYGSKRHLEALAALGRCPIHRRSFHPVSNTTNQRFRMRDNPQKAGWLGEIYAGMYFIRNGYELLVHGYHGSRDGEIDLIARKGREVIFVEVKSYLRSAEAEPAHYRVTPAKQRKIADTAEHFYSNENYKSQYPEEPDSRFDIVTVDFSRNKPTLQHFADAFLPL
ncbi:MAG: ribonuclease HII [Lentisphaeria bacterium]|nr:ribonuclease HII [Candidatus Neomarinimicrobiota bacterium]MCF7843158.1 ribonuclease HII [Lentisphaeria bacterium]